MTALPQSDAWDAGIYQIEISDPVLGGVSGPANLGAKGLANRTVFLRNALAGLSASMAWVEVVQTTSGNWTCPAGVTQVMILDARAGGGGGAGSGGASDSYGGGGGEGARAQNLPLTVVPATVYALGIGQGGAAGAFYNGAYDVTQLGANGTDTTFGGLLTLQGGRGGGDSSTSSNAVGGLGGSTTVGGLVYAGEHGWSNEHSSSVGNAFLGRGGGVGGSWRRTLTGAAVAANSGGGGCGGIGNGGALVATAGANGYIRFAYPLVTLSGLPSPV